MNMISLQKEGFDYLIKPQLFTDVFSENLFTDVTLACDGEKQIKAHKVILGSSSQFFKKTFLKNPHNHPLIFIRGISYNMLLSIVKFIYLGEIKLTKNEMDLFLEAIKDLEIDGFEELWSKKCAVETNDNTSAQCVVDDVVTTVSTSLESDGIDNTPVIVTIECENEEDGEDEGKEEVEHKTQEVCTPDGINPDVSLSDQETINVVDEDISVVVDSEISSKTADVAMDVDQDSLAENPEQIENTNTVDTCDDIPTNDVSKSSETNVLVQSDTDLVNEILVTKEDDASQNDEMSIVVDDSSDNKISEDQNGDTFSDNKMSEVQEISNEGLRLKSVEEICVTITNEIDNIFKSADVKPNNDPKSSAQFYSCEQCEFKGVGRSMLKKHIQQLHGVPCDQCRYVATSRGNFWKHKRSEH